MSQAHPTIPGAVVFDDDAALALNDRCPAIIPISKDICEGRIHTRPERGHDCPCVCEYPLLDQTILTYSLLFKSEWVLESNTGCDQVKRAMLLDGCRVSIKGRMKLRLWDCPGRDGDKPGERGDLHIGCQEGEFVMYRPIDPQNRNAGSVPVFTGEVTGVVGLDPAPCPANGKSRCCQPNHVQGMLTGRGVGVMEDCTICAAYDGPFVSLEEGDICRPQDMKWKLTLDGIVCCPCPEHKKKYGKKKGK